MAFPVFNAVNKISKTVAFQSEKFHKAISTEHEIGVKCIPSITL